MDTAVAPSAHEIHVELNAAVAELRVRQREISMRPPLLENRHLDDERARELRKRIPQLKTRLASAIAVEANAESDRHRAELATMQPEVESARVLLAGDQMLCTGVQLAAAHAVLTRAGRSTKGSDPVGEAREAGLWSAFGNAHATHGAKLNEIANSGMTPAAKKRAVKDAVEAHHALTAQLAEGLASKAATLGSPEPFDAAKALASAPNPTIAEGVAANLHAPPVAEIRANHVTAGQRSTRRAKP